MAVGTWDCSPHSSRKLRAERTIGRAPGCKASRPASKELLHLEKLVPPRIYNLQNRATSQGQTWDYRVHVTFSPQAMLRPMLSHRASIPRTLELDRPQLWFLFVSFTHELLSTTVLDWPSLGLFVFSATEEIDKMQALCLSILFWILLWQKYVSDGVCILRYFT